MSTVVPGSGQLWVQRKYPGYGFMGTEATLGLLALISYYQYNKNWGGFDENYEDLLTSHADYQNLTFMCTVKDLSVIPNLVGSYNWIGIHKSITIF